MDNSSHDREFIQQYDAYVRGIVKHTRAQLGIEGDLDDMIAFAYEGLLEAQRRFDPARGVPFKSFAFYRVRGAVLDGVRRMAYLPRRAYARLKAAEAIDLEAESASEAGVASNDPAQAVRVLDGVLGRIAAAYCTAASADEEEHSAQNPERGLLKRELHERVRRALEGLPEPERTLVRGHYVEGRNFDEIAKELGLSKSWASRLHTRALERMREVLAALE